MSDDKSKTQDYSDNSIVSDDWLIDRLKLCEKPIGKAGVKLAHEMNEGHSHHLHWALDTYLQEGHHSRAKGLDIGCGGGATLQSLHKRYPTMKLAGIDYSKDMVRLAGIETEGYADISEGNVSDLPYSSDEFDIITACETVYFWPMLKNSFEGVLRILKKGGEFIIINELYDNPYNSAHTARNNRLVKLSNNLKLFTPDGLKDILESAGFKHVEHTTKPENNWICYRAIK